MVFKHIPPIKVCKCNTLSSLKYFPLDMLTTTPPQLVEKFKEATFSMRSNVITTQYSMLLPQNTLTSDSVHCTAFVFPKPSFQS